MNERLDLDELERIYKGETFTERHLLALVAELRQTRKALRRFVQALDAGIEYLPIHSRKTELVCRHCSGPSTTGSAWDFVHDENCIIVKGRNALARNDKGEQGE